MTDPEAPLKLYLLDVGEDDFDYDQLDSVVVCARSHADARFLAAAVAEEQQNNWPTPNGAWTGAYGPMPPTLAEALARIEADPETAHAPWWLDPDRSTCTEITLGRGVVHGHVHFG